MTWGKLALTGTVALGSLGAGDAAVLREVPLQAEYHLSERVTVEQKGNVVEATLPWKDQPGLKVKYDMGEPTVAERVRDKRKQEVITEQVNTKQTDLERKKSRLLSYKTDIEKKGTSTVSIEGLEIAATSTENRVHIADQQIQAIDEELATSDGFKMDVLLNEKPDTNRFCWTVEGAEQYDWFKQPPLTPEEIAEGAERPENVINSYAVYHKQLKNHIVGHTNYETGKVFHRYRVQATDANGAQVWGDSEYENGQICDILPSEWLETAAYPVTM